MSSAAVESSSDQLAIFHRTLAELCRVLCLLALALHPLPGESSGLAYLLQVFQHHLGNLGQLLQPGRRVPLQPFQHGLG